MIRELLGLHKWSYRNPFNRTCKSCKRNEVFHGYDEALTRQNGWWETFDDGNNTCKPFWEK